MKDGTSSRGGESIVDIASKLAWVFILLSIIVTLLFAAPFAGFWLAALAD